MMLRLLTSAVICSLAAQSATAFGFTEQPASTHKNDVNTRRRFLQSTAALTVASWTSSGGGGGNTKITTPWVSPASADESAVSAAVEVPMKLFVDTANPSYFAMEVPQRFFSIRRSAKGDLPDAKTGKGRRGGTIFTAGDMSKAEVIAVERFPIRTLLEEEGYQPSGDLTNFKAIGDPVAIATLLLRRREADKSGTQNKAILNRDSVVLSDDGQTMTFSMKQEIDVQKPELLLEQEGISELFRTTVAKATLSSNDGQLMAVFASALDQDFAGPDGVALQKSVGSFLATNQSGSN